MKILIETNCWYDSKFLFSAINTGLLPRLISDILLFSTVKIVIWLGRTPLGSFCADSWLLHISPPLSAIAYRLTGLPFVSLAYGSYHCPTLSIFQ